MVENGAVRTYEGHNNMHTMLQLGVDPTETLLISGNREKPVSTILDQYIGEEYNFFYG